MPQLWDRARVDALISTALIRHRWVMLAPSSPADSLQAAKEILGSEGVTFSHLANGYPVYTL